MSGDGPRLSVALDRRASCRVEAIPGGVEIESKESLTKASAHDVGELLERSPRSLAAQALALLGAASGVRVVTEWKVPAGSGIEGGAALALATTAAVSRALGREDQASRARRARAGGRRASRADGRARPSCGALRRGRADAAGAPAPSRPSGPPSIPDGSTNRCWWSTLGHPRRPAAAEASPPGPSAASRTGPIVEALRGGRYEDVVDLLAEEPWSGRCRAGSAPGRGARARGGRSRPPARDGEARRGLGSAGLARPGAPRGGRGRAQGGRTEALGDPGRPAGPGARLRAGRVRIRGLAR